MSERTDLRAIDDTVDDAATPTGGFFRRRVLALLAAMREAVITVVEPGAQTVLGTAEGDDVLRVTLQIRDAEAWQRIALGGTVGAAEAYMDGQWDASDLTTLVRILVRNRGVMDRMEGGLAGFGAALLRGWHQFRRNTARGSRRNIAAHYDLGNELFRLFLDETMMYSSAIYRDPSESLEAAQARKLDRICRKLDLKPGTRVVEIGTGWGGFAIHAARHYGAQVTTTTISREQRELAQARVQAAGLGDRITILDRDYRDLDGRFDRLVSIEMIEAIGHQYLDTYFGKVSGLLADDGMALIQAITIEDHRYDQALRSVDFIKRHIFPGSFIPSVGAMTGSIARSTDLKLFHLEDIGPSYALTLAAWRERFNAALDRVRAQGYPERFIRMWNYYLCYCEGGFIERSIGDVQMLLVKPGARPVQYLPDL
jgi:cyclopropane-fatty-acyl-phospholipid synthase